MRFKTTWILVAIFAALAAYLLLVENPQHQSQQKAEENRGLVFADFDTGKVTELAISGRRGSVRVRRNKSTQWSVVEPWNDRADDGRIATLLTDLKNLKADKEVAASEADLQPYGLAEPELTLRTLGIPVSLAVGGKSPIGDARYIRVDDGPVQIAKSHATSGFLLEPSDLRSKEVVAGFPWGRLALVAILPAEGPTVRLVKTDGTWSLEQPLPVAADPDAAHRVAEKLRWARVNRFLTPSSEKAETELSKGLAVVLQADGDDPPVTVRMAEVNGKVWADRTGRDALFTVSRDVFETFHVGLDQLRRKTPLVAKSWKIERLEMDLANTTRVYVKADGVWQRDGEPVDGEEQTTLQDYLRNLENTEAEQVIDEPGTAADYGLDNPVLVVKTVDTKGDEQHLAVGEAGDKVFARGSDAGAVYQMPAGYLEQARSLMRWTRAPVQASGPGSPRE